MALLDTVKSLLASPEEMESMAAAMKDLAVPDSADRIAELVLGLCR
jgi:UDP-N-acetylglucosamine:LPS N-acetylglucosamine transferase